MSNQDIGAEDDSNVITSSIEEEELVKTPKVKTVDFKGSLAEYFSDLLIDENNKGKPKEKDGDILIYTVKDKDDMEGYIEDTAKRADYIDSAVYVKAPNNIGNKVSMESNESFMYYLRTTGANILTTEREVKEYYEEATNETS